ncbi:MAG: hypothetical protein LBH43_15405 [Treponema sp.]|jgi:hypothetical protein|nr:hypothetical protein [Treponema sp.]
MKFVDKVNSFLKSLGGNPDEDKDEKNEEDDLEDQENGTDNDGGDGEDMNKANPDDELADATGIMKALVGELRAINKSLSAIAKRQDGIEKSYEDLGESVVGVAELVAKVANSPLPTKTTMAKGGLGNGNAGGDPGHLTKAEFDQAQVALTKACQAKRISLFDATRLETEMQKAMNIQGYRMRPEDAAIIDKELKTA